MKDSFKKYAANESNPNWNNIISRCTPLYKRDNDIRTEFGRDYTRIIHCNAYRRLKHKTQVFFSPDNDHICTRIEHVTHVESISYTIATYLGLNTELTKAIAVSHDIGHSPFGHVGERILSSLSQKDVGTTFWHEKNGLDFVDYIELLEDDNKYKKNLNLTYGVRDGIISHCGEVSENGLKPRTEYINLSDYKYPNQFAPYTWEACVVKLSDKISYIGRDIEDAITLGILDNHLDELYKLLDSKYTKDKINNTIIINYLITDLCENSSPEKGLCFSQDAYKYIYNCQRIQPSNRYFNIVLTEIYSLLKSTFEQDHTLENVENLNKFYPKLYKNFLSFLNHYFDLGNRENLKLKNQIVFNLNNEKEFYKAIIYFISGMTDNFAIEIYNEIIGF